MCGPVVRASGAPPSTGTTKMCDFPARPDWKATRVASGERLAARSSLGCWLRFLALFPPSTLTNTSAWPETVSWNVSTPCGKLGWAAEAHEQKPTKQAARNSVDLGWYRRSLFTYPFALSLPLDKLGVLGQLPRWP